MAKTRNLFISHSWSYSDSYEKLRGLLDADPNFAYANFSVPKDDPIHRADNMQQLYDAIKERMQFAQVVLIMAGVYATHSKWIKREIQIAKSDFDKPVLAIRPWGNLQISQTVRDNADELVSWNTDSIVTAIRNLVP